MKCVIDQRRDIESGQVCDGCRAWLARTLVEIVELYALLPANLTPGQAQGQRVSGSREAPLPLRVDPLDLGMPARAATVHDPLGDQIGLLSVATVLDCWARDWADVRAMRETLPEPSVAELAKWLGNRTDWACDHHPAIDEYAIEIEALRHPLRSVVGVSEIPPEHLDVPCRRCDLMDLHRLPGQDRVECGSCGDLLTEDEYSRWTKMLVADIRSHMKELVEFLRARLDEDEHIACGAQRTADFAWVPAALQSRWDARVDDHICRWSPERALAEVAAKRALLTVYTEAAAWYDANKSAPAGELHGLYIALQHIALPYAGHPDYDEAWRP